MGISNTQDVADEPDVDLLCAMQQAADRDQVAREYASAYASVFEATLPRLRYLLSAGWSLEWATTGCFLALLASEPDTLIVRKHGPARAAEVSAQASAMSRLLQRDGPVVGVSRALRAWDTELKAARVNPGTSADIIVATLFAEYLYPAGPIEEAA